MRPTDRTGLAIALSLVALTLFDAMGLVIKHLSATYSLVGIGLAVLVGDGDWWFKRLKRKQKRSAFCLWSVAKVN